MKIVINETNINGLKELKKNIEELLNVYVDDMEFTEKKAICQAICDGVAEGFGLKEGNYNSNEVGNNNENSKKEDFEMKVWRNGSTNESVYQDLGCTQKIGTIYPREYADCLGVMEGKYIVAYYVTDSKGNVINRKVGFVKYPGGIK